MGVAVGVGLQGMAGAAEPYTSCGLARYGSQRWAPVPVGGSLCTIVIAWCHSTMSHAHVHVPSPTLPSNLVGTWRRFGVAGPVYEIVSAGTDLPDGDRLMRVRVVESGEEVDYRYSEILVDPLER